MNEQTPQNYLAEPLPGGVTGQVEIVTPRDEQLAALEQMAEAQQQLAAIEAVVAKAAGSEKLSSEELNSGIDQTVAEYVGDGLRACADAQCATSVTTVGVVEVAKLLDQPHTATTLNDVLSSGGTAARAFEQSMHDAALAGVDIEEVARDMDHALTESKTAETYESIADALELTGSLRQVAIDLLSHGVSQESIAVNGVDGLALYESIATDQFVDEQTRHRATERVRRLYACGGLDFGGRTFDRVLLYSDAPNAERAIDAVQAVWREAMEVDYDLQIASKQIQQDFDGRYMYNDLHGQMDERYQDRADRLERQAAVMRATEGKTLMLNRELLSHETEQDYVLEGLVNDVDLDPADAAARVTQSQERMDLLHELPADERAVIEQTNIFTFDAARNLQQFATQLDRATMIAGFHEEIDELSADGETHSIVNRIYNSVEQNMERNEEPMSQKELEEAIRDVFMIHALVPAWSKRTIFGMLGVLENGVVRDIATDACMLDFLDKNAAEANGALGQLQYRPEADWQSALDVYEMTDQPFDELVKTMLQCEPNDQTLVAEYYALLKKTTRSVDKNGIPYSTPQGIEQALQSPLYTPENREWFLQSGDVPMVMFDAVNRFRATLTARGVEDSAAAVYEAFCDDPELIAEESVVHVENYVSSLRIVDEDRVAELMEAAHADAEARKDQFRVFVNIDLTALRKSIETTGGALKSIMDTDVIDRSEVGASVGVRRSANYIYHRADVEAMIGARARGDQEHPIYGSCGFVDRGGVAGARGYGDIVLSFKPSEHGLRDRTTYTPEDSFRSIHRLTEEDAATLRVIKNGAGQGFTRTNEYIEAQIVGGVNVDDAAEIFVPEELAVQVRGVLPSARLEKVVITTIGLEDRLSGDRAYDNTAEKALVEQYKKGAPVELQSDNMFGDMEY